MIICGIAIYLVHKNYLKSKLRDKKECCYGDVPEKILKKWKSRELFVRTIPKTIALVLQ